MMGASIIRDFESASDGEGVLSFNGRRPDLIRMDGKLYGLTIVNKFSAGVTPGINQLKKLQPGDTFNRFALGNKNDGVYADAEAAFPVFAVIDGFKWSMRAF